MLMFNITSTFDINLMVMEYEKLVEATPLTVLILNSCSPKSWWSVPTIPSIRTFLPRNSLFK